MTDHKLILATDLDGTFLGGSDEDRRALYQALQARDDALLIFVTGRDLGFIRELVAEPGMPHPDFVIGDVGTTVVAGRDFRVVDEVQAPIARAWNDAGVRVKAMLSGEPGIRLQPTPFERRVSYWYEPAELDARTLHKIEQAGFDWLLSADTFLDVLPKGVAKGPTLLQLVETLNLPADRVLVAGDTLNDLSLFETGLKGVAVGNSEPRLVEQLTDKPWVYRSTGHGAAGIAEAIRHFGLD
jgi:hydroxymethylpyrimidine pyrophosphatase-like HAD family hydrolase